MNKGITITASILALLSVILGALNAHAFKSIFTSDLIESFDTGLKYQMYHAIVLFILGLHFEKLDSTSFRWTIRFLLSGIFLFSGSIYLLCFMKSQGIIGLYGLGLLTPLGGICFITGWLLLIISVLKKPR